jgi:ribosomal protein S12 methylthiotransferase accessory factor
MEKGWRLGSHWAVPPAETVARLRPLLPLMGITRLADVTGLDRIGVSVFQAIRPLSRSVSVSQGKGLDPDAARASALMEAVETWHAERIDRPLRLARERDLAQAARVIDTGRLPRVAGTEYDPGRLILWLQGQELGSGEPVWVPYEPVHTDYTLPQPAGSGFFLTSTNGLASGNVRAEAVIHALCELIERDAVGLWFRSEPASRAATAVDPDSVDDPACRKVLDRCAEAGCAIVIWNVTSDVGVPAYQCLLLDERDPQGHGGLGSGCHPAREVALLRALTEAVQVRMTYVSGARDDLSAAEYTSGARVQRLRQATWLATGSRGGIDYQALPGCAAASFEADLAAIDARLAGAGVGPVVIVDLARPEIGVAVVRALVPGLEGPDDHPSYTPGARARRVRETVP